MLDTRESCSIISYRNFWEVYQLQHPITRRESTKVTKTYIEQTIHMIRYATVTFGYDPEGQFIFRLTAWITELRTQNLLAVDFCQKQVSGILFDLPGIEMKNPPKSICYVSFQQEKPILIYHKFWQLEPLIRCVLTLKVPVVGSILTQTLIHTSQQAQFFNQIEILCLLAYLP